MPGDIGRDQGQRINDREEGWRPQARMEFEGAGEVMGGMGVAIECEELKLKDALDG